MRGGRGNFPRKKLAIGRNVFPDGEEESDETGAGRGRGKPKLAIGRNVFNDPSETSGGRGEGRGRFSKKRGVAVGRGDQGGTAEQLVGRNVTCLQQLFEEQEEF